MVLSVIALKLVMTPFGLVIEEKGHKKREYNHNESTGEIPLHSLVQIGELSSGNSVVHREDAYFFTYFPVLPDV
jgi:hypothetical protein